MVAGGEAKAEASRHLCALARTAAENPGFDVRSRTGDRDGDRGRRPIGTCRAGARGCRRAAVRTSADTASSCCRSSAVRVNRETSPAHPAMGERGSGARSRCTCRGVRRGAAPLSAPGFAAGPLLRIVLEELAAARTSDAQVDATGVHGIEQAELLDDRQARCGARSARRRTRGGSSWWRPPPWRSGGRATIRPRPD